MSAAHPAADLDADQLAEVLIENESVDRDLEQLAEVEGLQQRGGVSYKVRCSWTFGFAACTCIAALLTAPCRKCRGL